MSDPKTADQINSQVLDAAEPKLREEVSKPLILMNDGTACDMLCRYCGRPVIGTMVWGAQGPYHPECTAPPIYRAGEPPIEIDQSKRNIALRLLVEKWRENANFYDYTQEQESTNHTVSTLRQCAKELEEALK